MPFSFDSLSNFQVVDESVEKGVNENKGIVWLATKTWSI